MGGYYRVRNLLGLFTLLFSLYAYADETITKEIFVPSGAKKQVMVYSYGRNIIVHVKGGLTEYSWQNSIKPRSDSETLLLHPDSDTLFQITAVSRHKDHILPKMTIESEDITNDVDLKVMRWQHRIGVQRYHNQVNELLYRKDLLQKLKNQSPDLVPQRVWLLMENKDYLNAYREGESYLQQAKDINLYDKVILRWALAEAQFRLENYHRSLILYRALLDDINAGNTVKSQSLQQSMAWRLNLAEISGRYGFNLIQMGYMNSDSDQIEQGSHLLQKAIEQVERLGDYKLLANLLNLMAPYYWFHNNYKEAEKVLRLSWSFHNRSGSDDHLPSVLNNLGLNLMWTGRIVEAQYIFRQ